MSDFLRRKTLDLTRQQVVVEVALKSTRDTKICIPLTFDAVPTLFWFVNAIFKHYPGIKQSSHCYIALSKLFLRSTHMMIDWFVTIES